MQNHMAIRTHGAKVHNRIDHMAVTDIGKWTQMVNMDESINHFAVFGPK